MSANFRAELCILVLLACLRFFVTTGAVQQRRQKAVRRVVLKASIPSIEFVGLGYDVILGNPHSEDSDPGFRQPVILLKYANNSTTSDGKWLKPDRVHVLPATSCDYKAKSVEATGSTSYQRMLSEDVGLDVSVGGAAVVRSAVVFGQYMFTASSGFRQVSESSKKRRTFFMSTIARCVAYTAEINHRYENFKVTRAFAQAVDSLPTVRDNSTYVRFIATYGTHFASKLYMGAKAVVRSEFDSIGWAHIHNFNTGFRSTPEVNFGASQVAVASFAVSISSSLATHDQRRLAAIFDASRRSYAESYLGSHPPPDGKWETWAAKTGETPYPIQYSLVPLTELLTKKFFPDEEEKTLATKRDLLKATIDAYCARVPGCGFPDPDREPIKVNRVNATFIATIRQSCRPGLSLLSCGIDTRSHGPNPDFHRYSVPISSTECECNDNSGAVCSQWCTNSVNGFEIAIAEKSGSFGVSCPSGKKVLGCHLRPKTDKEVWSTSYPTDDGTGCTCYDHFGAACYATCASNIVNHEVRSEFGKGLVTVTCSPSNYVLGCGVKPVKQGAVEKWRYHQVASSNSCECYDNDAGVTCYALCGQFA